MQELADLAGVSRATVSRALSDSPLVNEKTKAKIRALAEKYNYTVNTAARNFRLQKHNVIAVVFMLEIQSDQHMSDPFFLEMLGGIADCLSEHDYDLLLAHAPIPDISKLQNSRLFVQSDGVIFIGQGLQHAKLNKIAQAKTPIVVWGASMPDKQYCLVGGDNKRGAYLSTSHLLENGRKKIAFFGNVNSPEIAQRYEGYKMALQEHKIKQDDRLQINVPFEMQHARETISELLASNAKFDAAVCCSDVMALSAITTLNEHGLKVPEDVAIVGYDDIGLAAYSNPPLTTVRQNIRWAGRVLVESVLSIINGETVPDTFITSELIVRQSSGAKT
ncbi:MAG: LacI family DNA-binding transcriptional regulator [Gammaproteobacteria bacterium]|nr:LacI family DNA-binding transcriptional regulator [Gammaproteobacteria bacterium]